MRHPSWRFTVVGFLLGVTGVVATAAMPMSSQAWIPTATAAQQRAIAEGYSAVLSEARLTGGLSERPVKRVLFDDILVDTRRASLSTQERIRDISCAASLVITGTATKVDVFADVERHALFTEFAIAVVDVLRGSIDSSPIRYIRPGGELDVAGRQIAMQHDRFPALSPESEYVFFLTRLPDGFWGAAAQADLFIVEGGVSRVLPSSRGNPEMANGIPIGDLTRWIRPCAPTPLGGISDGRSGLASPPRGRAQLAGDVVSVADGRPLANVLVVLTRSDDTFVQQALTEEDGMFAFPVVAPGVFKVWVVHPGFETALLADVNLLADTPRLLQPIRLSRLPPPPEPPASQTLGPGFTARLPRLGVRDEWFSRSGLPQGRAVPVRGNVTDAEGLLVGDTLVIARNAVGNRRAWQTRTAADGAYILALGLGVYSVEISRAGYRPVTLSTVRVEGERVQLPSVRLQASRE